MENKNIKEEEATKYWLHYFRRNDVPELSAAELDQQSEYMYAALMQTPELSSFKTKRLNYTIISAAAAVLLILGVSFFYFKSSNIVDNNQLVKAAQAIPVPGRTAATLILADGRQVALADVLEGKIADQTGVEIFKAADNNLVYRASAIQAGNSQSNTVLTANGEQYSVDLPDGTKVWLNAASSLKFPTTFNSKDSRIVELTGEAYFEVTKDTAHPFIVKTDKQEIMVLGTHFNVCSYGDEQTTKTTLLEGSVKVISKTKTATIAILKPGQQAQLSAQNLQVKEVDLSESVAWKNGDFNFENEELSSVLNQVSRWYNVEIIDNGKHDGLKLSGMVSRSKSLATVLKSLEGTAKLKFKVEGKKVTVID